MAHIFGSQMSTCMAIFDFSISTSAVWVVVVIIDDTEAKKWMRRHWSGGLWTWLCLHSWKSNKEIWKTKDWIYCTYICLNDRYVPEKNGLGSLRVKYNYMQSNSKYGARQVIRVYFFFIYCLSILFPDNLGEWFHRLELARQQENGFASGLLW